MLTRIFNMALGKGEIPEEWKMGIIIPIFKNGDMSHCGNHRGITLFDVIAKMYKRLLEGTVGRS